MDERPRFAAAYMTSVVLPLARPLSFTAKLELPVAILPEAQSGGGFRLSFSFHARLGERGAPVEFSGWLVPV
jgi:hypothetical protein